MKTLQTVLNDLKLKFKEKNIETYSLDAQLIIMNVLDISRVKLIAYPDLEIDDANYDKIITLANERMNYKPMQYILGKCEFMGLDFYVNENTLIPRGDTEVLVEQAIETIKTEGLQQVLDIGTGSGAIAVSLAYYTDANVRAVDISSKALEVAKRNAVSNNVDIEFIQSDLFENVSNKFDIIVSNPPYIETDVIKTLEPQVKDFEPMLALDGGVEGLDFYVRIIDNCHKFLNNKGWLMFEIGYNQGEALAKLMKNANFDKISVKKDLAGLDRVVIGQKI